MLLVCTLHGAQCFRSLVNHLMKRNFDTGLLTTYHSPLPSFICALFQIWDFHLGRLRGHKDSNSFEDAYGTGNMGFTIKNFGEFLKETSPSSPKLGGETYQINCSSTHEDMPSFNVSPALFFTLSAFRVSCHLEENFVT